ncbi:hypothetical protein GQX73_g3264 [Xylaria multiplex]|uniref:Uncharacterized protein n=1 Tax=Xylaria multiplex TaxID=323545 RepID=A0A7C8MWP3_9PEZI|nr:hypothetical protein GQX73_g3264 [Xylaria multiplex]
MPPLCSEKRCPRIIGRHSSVSSKITRPTLLIRNVDNDSDDADESDENISPDADKSEIRFTLEKKRDKDDRDGKDKDKDKNNDDGNRRGRNRSKGDRNQDRRNGRGGDSNDTSRSRDGGDEGRGFGFDEKDDRGDDDDERGKSGGDKGGNRSQGGGDGGDRGRGQDSNRNGDGKEGDGKGGPGKDGGSDSGSNDNNSSTSPPPPPPPPPPATTSTTSVVEASITTSVVVSTSIPTSETTTSSTSEDSTKPILTALPAVTNPSPTILTPLIPTTSTVPNLDGILDNSQTSTTTFAATDAADSSSALAPAQTSPPNSGKENGRHRGGNNNNGNNRGDRGGLSRTSERILVAAGSIGVFIVLCFIVWIIYRTVKKSKKSSSEDNSNSWLPRLIPWRRKPETNNVQALRGTYQSQEPLPAYDAGNNSMEAFGYYDRAKLYALESENTTYPSAVTLRDGRAVWQAPEEAQLPPLPPANSLGQYPQPDNQITDSSDADATLRSRMPDPYYNQSEFARQPSDAYNPAQRQVYRASEISSLSSGFGDGDIIMPPPNVVIPKTPIAATNADVSNRPFSWMTRTEAEQRRDTVYTTTTERRFRSIGVSPKS